MAIPELDEIRRPALALLAKLDKLTKIGDVFDLLAPHFSLSKEERNEMLPSGTQRRWHNRTNWACYDLFRAGALDRPVKGRYKINARGRALLDKGPEKITRQYLKQEFSEFEEFMTPSGTGPGPKPPIGPHPDDTPEEQIDRAMTTLWETLSAELLECMAAMDAFRFEHLVVDLLFAMGYGGSREEAAKVTRKSNDEGIDGIINEDRLGLDVIYVQAKRWQATIGRKEIQSFVGALAGKQAAKGVFITTSDFAHTARNYAETVTQKVILIDGRRLAELMIEHDVGVSTTRSIALKRIDSDYFEES